MLVRVRMRTTMAGPMGTYAAGAVVDFADGLAQALIAGGYAEPVGSDAPPAVAAAAEMSSITPGSEAAVMPRAPRKRG